MVSVNYHATWMILMFFFALSLFGCATGGKQVTQPLQVVPYVDIKKYMGVWYEIARYPNSFQEGCFASKATYTLLEDGKVDVLNQCHKGSLEGRLSSAKGKAWAIDSETNAKLKVSFFWPFAGDYWIIDLGENYEYAVVGHPDRKYLWILSRTPQMDDPLYNRILEKLQQQSYDVTKLVKTPQK